MYDCREGRGVIIGNTLSVSISFLFLFFFHQSSLYSIKIFVKCLYLLVYIYMVRTSGFVWVCAMTFTPGVGCTTSALVCTCCTRGVRDNGVITLVVLKSAEILVYHMFRNIFTMGDY